ncbi:hypothetical protein Tco_0117010 [Tanacetum coccineum]
MDLLFFIQTSDPIKVRIGERQRAEGEPKLLDTTMGRVVPLLPVAPTRASSEIEASVDKLFDEGGIGSHAEQGDSVSCGHGVGVLRQRKRKMVVFDAGEPSHPPKKLREDHRTSTGPSVTGKSRSALQILLVGAVLNPEVGVVALPTLPFITSFVSVTPEREDGDQTDFMAGANLRTITAPLRFIISSNSSHHSGANIAEAEAGSFSRPSAPLMTMTTTITSMIDPTTTAKEIFSKPSFFGGGSSSGAEHTVGGFSGLTGSDFIVGGIRTVVSLDTDLQKKRRLSAVVEEKDSLLKASNEEVASLKAQLLVKEAKAVEAILLRVEVQALADRNTVLEGEKSELDVKVADLAATVKVREQEVADLYGVVTSVKVHNDNLSDQVHTLEDDRMRGMNENFDKLDTDLVELALHLEERFYPHRLTTISGRRWLLTYGLELAIAKCLNSTKYLSSLGAAIGKAVEKGMQEGLSAGITHRAADRVLTDVATYNPFAEADYLSALQHLQSVNFSLITELKSNKDASIYTIMNLLRLEDSLVERLGLTEPQPRVDQLMVPNQRVIGASALSLSLDVSSSRVQRIRENIANHRLALCDPHLLLLLTFISIEDYEDASTDGQEVINISVLNDATGGNVNPFPNVDDVELNVSQ